MKPAVRPAVTQRDSTGKPVVIRGAADVVRRLGVMASAVIPEGSRLPDAAWHRRHAGILIVLWAHAIGIVIVSLSTGQSVAHSLFEGGIVAAAALLAGLPFGARTVQAGIAGFGLIASSAILVHLSGGYIESHFHFFVMVGLMALYQEWIPFLLAIVFVLLHHGVVGVLDPSAVYNHPAALGHPWLWAGIHAGFIAAMSVVSLLTWRLNEMAALENARLYERVRQAYEELSRTQEQLTQAQKMDAVGRLAGGVAHDFNNLLSIITGRSTLLRRAVKGETALLRHVDIIEQTAERAASLTGQLLAFSRKQVIQPKVLDLNGLVGNVTTMLRSLIGEDIELVTRPGSALALVKADPGQLEQVLMNFVVNARDAMPRGGQLTIETANTMLDASYAAAYGDLRVGPHVMLAVSDTGTGIDPATRARIFEPFFTTKGPGKGTGLGLSMVYGIVKQNGGHIAVDSEVGHGTTFKIYLPAIDQPIEAEHLARPNAPRGSETILLVEDEEELRAVLGEMLEERGYAVVKARDGVDAIRICIERDGAIDLLLTDVVMPQMRGPELVRRVQARWPTMKVLYMSGYIDSEIVHEGLLDPGIAFLQKPFTPVAVARKIREVLDRPTVADADVLSAAEASGRIISPS